MDELVGLLTKLVYHVFGILAGVVAAFLFYQLLFGGTNSALRYACKSVETPISFYYYQYSYYPSVHVLDGVSNTLGIETASYVNVSDLSSSDTDNSSSVAQYSTGWR